MRRRHFAATLGVLPFAQGIFGRGAFAQGDDWPTRNVRIVCPFTPGGSQDNIARRLGAKLQDYLGQTFVIENRSGAGGSIAADVVAKSPPDGYSMLLGGIASHAVAPNLYSKLPYNPFTDLDTAAWIGTQPNLLCCHPSFPHDTVPKLIAASKKEPGKYQYGSSGVGASPSVARRRAAGLLEVLGLAARADQPAGALAHGDERRLGVARALATEPQFVLMDEPAAGLPEAEVPEFAAVVRSVRDDHDAGVLLIDHNMALIMEVCDRLLVLDQGRTLAEGTPDEIRENLDVVAAYLGESAVHEADA